MSISLNTQMSGMTQQPNLNLQPKISKENEILKNQIIEIGKTDPNRASMLSRKICTWDGSQKALDQLSAEGLNVSHIVVPKLLGGMMSAESEWSSSVEIKKIIKEVKKDLYIIKNDLKNNTKNYEKSFSLGTIPVSGDEWYTLKGLQKDLNKYSKELLKLQVDSSFLEETDNIKQGLQESGINTEKVYYVVHRFSLRMITQIKMLFPNTWNKVGVLTEEERAKKGGTMLDRIRFACNGKKNPIVVVFENKGNTPDSGPFAVSSNCTFVEMQSLMGMRKKIKTCVVSVAPETLGNEGFFIENEQEVNEYCMKTFANAVSDNNSILVDYAEMLETGSDVRHDEEVMNGMLLSQTLQILATKFYGPKDLKDYLLSELDKDSENCDIKSAKTVHNIISKYLLEKGFSKKPAVTIRNDVLSECKVNCKKMNFGFRDVAQPMPGGLASNFMDQKTYDLMLKGSKPADFTTFYNITGKGAIYLNDEHYGDDIWWGQGSMHVQNNKNFFGIGTNRRYRQY